MAGASSATTCLLVSLLEGLNEENEHDRYSLAYLTGR